MSKWRITQFLLLGATLIMGPGSAQATPTDGTITWRLSGYVHWWRVLPNGNITVTFKDSAGAVMSRWVNGSNVDVCDGQPALTLVKDHSGFTAMSQMLAAAGLAGKRVKIGYQPYSGACYLKELLVTM